MALCRPIRPALYRSSASTWGGSVIARRATVALTRGTYCCTICSSNRLPFETQRELRTRGRFNDFFTRTRPLPFLEHGGRFLIIFFRAILGSDDRLIRKTTSRLPSREVV